MWGFIYSFKFCDKEYIGCTIDLKQRFKKHFKDKRRNKYFHNSLRKYFKSGDFKIIEVHQEKIEKLYKILLEREIFWIKERKTYDPKQIIGWNLTKGGEGSIGYIASKETREKISKIRIERKLAKGKNNPNYGNHKLAGINHPMFGKHHSKEARQKMKDNFNNNPNAGFKNKKHKKITKIKMKNARKNYLKKYPETLKGENNPMFGRNGEKHPMFGKHHSVGTIQKIKNGWKKRLENKKNISNTINNIVEDKKL